MPMPTLWKQLKPLGIKLNRKVAIQDDRSALRFRRS